MAEKESPYKQVRIDDVITDARLRDSLADLNEAWGSEIARIRLEVASKLAFSLLRLFTVTTACIASVIAILIITYTVTGKTPEELEDAIQSVSTIVTMLLPYIATPVGVALGYFFSDQG